MAKMAHYRRCEFSLAVRTGGIHIYYYSISLKNIKNCCNYYKVSVILSITGEDCETYLVNTMLQYFITSKTRRKIIMLFSKYPDYKIHIRGLAKIIREDPGNIARELAKLEKIGYVRSAKDGNTKVYWANQTFLLFKELQSMVLKTSNKK